VPRESRNFPSSSAFFVLGFPERPEASSGRGKGPVFNFFEDTTVTEGSNIVSGSARFRFAFDDDDDDAGALLSGSTSAPLSFFFFLRFFSMVPVTSLELTIALAFPLAFEEGWVDTVWVG